MDQRTGSDGGCLFFLAVLGVATFLLAWFPWIF
jgi:hypothetical protein